MPWVRSNPGLYEFKEDGFAATVVQQGEYWCETVFFQGRMVEFGEWDGREIAFRNALNAMDKITKHRSLVDRLNLPATEEHDDDD